MIIGTADFYGFNYYTSTYAYEPAVPSKFPSYFFDREADSIQDPEWPMAKSVWLRSIPEGFRELLK